VYVPAGTTWSAVGLTPGPATGEVPAGTARGGHGVVQGVPLVGELLKRLVVLSEVHSKLRATLGGMPGGKAEGVKASPLNM
jgi:hypothetical protein